MWKHGNRISSSVWIPLLGVAVLAASLRIFGIGRIPPGLYHDEAYNGLDALSVLQGNRPLYFSANNGREPLFIYLVALTIGVLGRSPGAVRIVSVLLGTATIPFTYLLTREMFGRRVALWAALAGAISVWPINLSRVGFRAVAMPLTIALAFWLLARGMRRRRTIDFALAGALYGLTFYTYLAARFTIIAVLGCAVYLYFTRRERIPWRQGIVFLAMVALVALPLMLYATSHWDEMLRRVAQVSIVNPVINEGDFWGTLGRQIVRCAAMFIWRGDFIPRHNVPLRPVFDIALAPFFLLGLSLSLWRASRGQTAYVLPLIWVGSMLLPSILAEDAPHFLRGVGVLPWALMLPAIGLDVAGTWVGHRIGRGTAWLIPSVILVLSLVFTWRDYFGVHAASPAVYYQFETGVEEMASEINRFTGAGWPGKGLVGREEEGILGTRAYVSDRLWTHWPSLRYLVRESPFLAVLEPGRGLAEEIDETLLILSPSEDRTELVSSLPSDGVISVHEGSQEQGDLETEPRLLYLSFQVSRDAHVPNNLGIDFEHGIRLLGATTDSSSPSYLEVKLFWQTERRIDTDYTVFIHLTSGDGAAVTQNDAQPAAGYYPTTLWRPGDVVVDIHRLTLPESFDPTAHALRVGMYDLSTMERVNISGATEEGHLDYVEVPLSQAEREQ